MRQILVLKTDGHLVVFAGILSLMSIFGLFYLGVVGSTIGFLLGLMLGLRFRYS